MSPEHDALGPRVSVIIDNYNYAQYLAEAIDSALAQDWRNLEVIVVDDGSTDGSRAIIAAYEGRVRALLQANSGQAAACNAGFATCSGSIVIFLDADDKLLPEAASTVVRMFAETGAANVRWPLRCIDAAGVDNGEQYPFVELSHGDLRARAIESGPYSTHSSPMSGNAYTREALEQMMPVQDSGDGHGADAFLAALTPLVGRIERVDAPLGCYRMHGGNFSKRSTLENLRRHVRRFDFLCQAMIARLAEEGIHARPDDWKARNESYRWMREMLDMNEQLMAELPENVPIVLIEGGTLGSAFLPGRRVHLLKEVEGAFAGLPEDESEALEELERLRAEGVRLVVVPKSMQWWLDSVPRVRAHLASSGDNESRELFSLFRQ